MSCCLLTGALLLLWTASGAAVKRESFQTSRGLNVVSEADSSMEFVHAQLVIFYKDKFTNPAIPALTFLNLFDRTLNNEDSSTIFESLVELGRDFQVEQTPDFFILKLNFLPDRLPQLIRFLKLLFNASPFAVTGVNPESFAYQKQNAEIEKKFNRSVAQYWRLFFNQGNWKREISFQIGYSSLFPANPAGNTLVTAATIKKATLADLRKFYQRVFRLPNSLVVIKGNFKPHMARAYLNSEFINFKPQIPEVPPEEKITANPKREIIVFHTSSADNPILYWFEAIEPVSSDNHIPRLLMNKILFGFPFGRVVTELRKIPNCSQDIQSELNNHQSVSVICNSIELRYRDIEPFIQITDRERRRLNITKIGRNEFLNVLSYFNGKMKVNSQFYDNDIGHEILNQFYSFKKNNFIEPARKSLEATLAALNRKIEVNRIPEPAANGVIVIVGNYDLIRKNLKTLKPEIYNQQ